MYPSNHAEGYQKLELARVCSHLHSFTIIVAIKAVVLHCLYDHFVPRQNLGFHSSSLAAVRFSKSRCGPSKPYPLGAQLDC